MIKVFFGLDSESILDIDTYFNNVFVDSWLEDDFVKHMIKDVDNSEVISKSCIQSHVLGQIPPERLSGGVKALICLYMLEDFKVDLIVCGRNCEEWIKRIGEMKDITVSISGYDLLFTGMELKAICVNDNSIITNGNDWYEKALDFVEVGRC